MALIALDTDVSSLIIKDKLPAAMAAKLVGNKLAISFVTVGELTKWVELRQWGLTGAPGSTPSGATSSSYSVTKTSR